MSFAACETRRCCCLIGNRPQKKPHPGSVPGLRLLFASLLFLGATDNTRAQSTREQAVTALLAPGSGVIIETNVSTVWSPFADFGFGAGFEGLLPAGSAVDPKFPDIQPFPGPGMAATDPSYFFWVDDSPSTRFVHSVRFILVDAGASNPTLANGGITVSTQGWWPVITLPEAGAREFFSADFEMASDLPSGARNPQGLIAGPAPPASGWVPMAAPGIHLLASSNQTSNRACGLVFTGAEGVAFSNDVVTYRNDLIHHYGVDPGRIKTVNDGKPATRPRLIIAIRELCDIEPPCDKIFIRITSHGGVRRLVLSDGSIRSDELCRLFQPLVAKGVPICLLLDACLASSIPDAANWNFPPGSSLVFSSQRDRSAWGGRYVEGAFGLYSRAFSDCLNSDPTASPSADLDGNGLIDDCEAHDWVLTRNPCYTPITRLGPADYMLYPAGEATGGGSISDYIRGLYPDPRPQKRTVGRNPFATITTVRNGTTTDKTDFHILYQGNVSNGLTIVEAMRSNPEGRPVRPWATNGLTIAYDSTNDQTMVCWEDASDFFIPGEYLNVRVFRTQGGLRPASAFWTPTAPPPMRPAPADAVPSRWLTLYTVPDEEGLQLYVVQGAETLPAQATSWLAISALSPLPPEELHPDSPAVENLPATSLGSHTLPSDAPLELDVPVPPPQSRAPLPTMIFRSDGAWSLNGSDTIQLDQFILDLPPEDTACITNCPGTGVFMTVNPPGSNSMFQWYKDGQPIAGATNGTLTLLDLRGIDEGIYTGIATNAADVKRKFFKLFIVDNTPPTLNCPSNIIVECAGPGGTPVNYQVSAGDNCGGSVSIECEPPPGSLFPLGTTFVSCIARDTFQNPAVCTFTVTVVDTTPPELSCQPDRLFTSSGPIIFSYSIDGFDNCDGENVTVDCQPPSGSIFLHGTTLVTCTAADASGNQSTCTFTVTVRRPGDSTITAARQDGSLTLSWNDEGAVLERGDTALGPWTSMPGAASPHTITINPALPEEYFRLFFPEAIQQLQGVFNSSDPAGANTAYEQFFNLGAGAIEPLIQLTGSSGAFAGNAYQHPLSSRTPMDPLSVKIVAVYLVDGILLGSHTPHYAPALISETPMTPQQKEDQAVSLYQNWWFANRGKSLQELREGSHPFEGSGLRWNGPLLIDQAAPAEGVARTNSSTPVYPFTNNPCLRMLDGADAGTEPDSYAWEYRPLQPRGPSPYNCMAWAVNCYTDRWLDTPATRTAVWEQVLRDYGYDVAAGPLACEGRCAEGRGPKLKMIFHVKPGEEPGDENWVHVMKQEDDGDWSSKNGQGPLFENIKDCEKFLDRHYKVPNGQMRLIRCYCK